MFCDENLILVVGGEHAAGVEAHSEGGHMCAEADGRGLEFGARALLAELWVWDVRPVAIGKSEVHSLLAA